MDEAILKHDGSLQLPEKLRRRWGLFPGVDVRIEDTAEGLLLRPADPPLRKVYVEPTTACNLNCPICVRRSWDEPVGSMEMDTYRKLIGDLRPIPTLRTIAFWGLGEPLLHRGITEMVSLAAELGVQTELITNALLLDERTAEGLVLAGLDILVVSVDGGTAGSSGTLREEVGLDQLREKIGRLHAVRRAHARTNPEVGLEFVITRKTLPGLATLPDLAHSLGASHIVVTNLLPHVETLRDEILYWLAASKPLPKKRSRWNPEIRLPRLDARPEVLESLGELLRRLGTIDPLLPHPERIRDYCRFVREGGVAVLWNGGVSPCVPLMHTHTCYILGRKKAMRSYIVGNIRERPLGEIWNGEEYRRFRRRVLEFDFAPCADCSGCDLAEKNEEDCYANGFPVCGDCLWARGIVQCP